MYKIDYLENSYGCNSNETVLEAMLRHGVTFPFSCRKGSCHSCMHIAEKGTLPPQAQKGLHPEQVEQGLFLPCLCVPVDNLSISPRKKKLATERATKPQAGTLLSPDPEMWEALDNGRLLAEIMKDFYARVYKDERLSPFFQGVTQQRAREKQHLFMRQQFTGERIYLGDKPKNAHHWMVISNDLFDYREAIMVDCLKRQGLPGHLIERWRALENSFRADIVKDEPWPRTIGDIEIPVSGYGELTLDSGSLCDNCGEEVNEGTTIRYHLRLGTIYCPGCTASSLTPST
ncbi:2Fe-2S iron-sulfur cluster-binding protein [Marinobacter salexigens]|uniref:2Fe-2S iron-sulfur cluster-binding protein n=1 Tax=Marinobacter salexigens TaxID=1925763 RepID=UPI000C286421|nr:2Fe-2S iron-sulfur cluster-binding protein [Marinobacter salexigens]